MQPGKGLVSAESDQTVHFIDFLGLTAQIVAPCQPFERLLPIPLGGYPRADHNAPANFQVMISPSEEPGFWDITVGERTFAGIEGADRAACKAEWCVVTEGLSRLSGFIHIHSAALATPDQSFLLVGNSGHGKSTTSIALALAGCDLLTDDVALIDREDLRPLTVPRPIKLDQRSRHLLRKLGLRVPSTARLNESDARRSLPGLPDTCKGSPPVRTIFFLRPGDRTRTELTPITNADAILRLSYHSSTETLAAGSLLGSVFELVQGAQCFYIMPGPLKETVRIILDIVGAPESYKRYSNPLWASASEVDVAIDGRHLIRPSKSGAPFTGTSL